MRRIKRLLRRAAVCQQKKRNSLLAKTAIEEPLPLATVRPKTSDNLAEPA
jgi:hypothetical protein